MPKFVVHKHRSKKLHYDLRLEIHSVLKSWVLPKGPSMDHDIKRMAFEAEDRQITYIHFEGETPEGQNGAGEIIIWDRGDFECVSDVEDVTPEDQYDAGRIELIFHGKKLKGIFVLLKVCQEEHPPKWLMKKKLDRHSTNIDILEEKPGSVVSLRNIE